MPTSFKFFPNEEAALSSLTREAIATLREDLHTQGGTREQQEEWRDKIHDLELLETRLADQFTVLTDWVADVEALLNGAGHLRESWPTLGLTYYDKAKTVVARRTPR